MSLTQEQVDTAMGQDSCFMGKPALSFPPLIRTTYPSHFSPRASAAPSVAICFSWKVEICIRHPLQWVSGSQCLGKRCSAASWSSQPPPRCHEKELTFFFCFWQVACTHLDVDLVCITVTEKLPFYFRRPPINVVSVTLLLFPFYAWICRNLDKQIGQGAEETIVLRPKQNKQKQRLGNKHF